MLLDYSVYFYCQPMIAIIIIANIILITRIIISVEQPEFDSREGDVFPSVLSIICKFFQHLILHIIYLL